VKPISAEGSIRGMSGYGMAACGAKLPFTGMSALGIRTGHATLADEVAYARFPIGTTFLSLRGTRDTTAALARSSKAVAMYFA
jgi:hypothetical protein